MLEQTSFLVTQENVDAVRKLIIEDRHVTYREIEASLKISKTSIQKILHEELGVRKLVSRWIPHQLTEEQKAARVNWCQKTLDRFNSGNSKNVYSIVSGEEKPTKVIRSRSVSKKMDSTFVSKAGHIAKIPLNEQITVTADWYITICLPKYLTEENVPDLSPNDFFTFPKIRNKLRGQRFQSPEEAVDAFKNAVLDLPANEWNECFENWFERLQMCINLPLQPDDFPARVRFCEWLLHQHDNNPDFLKCILVTDESTFTRNGTRQADVEVMSQRIGTRSFCTPVLKRCAAELAPVLSLATSSLRRHLKVITVWGRKNLLGYLFREKKYFSPHNLIIL
ncbi:unnamed protein product [Acanthoscelides obtectus]|uniref:Transposase n=1 Tax=Acanthoscelides obtectus TaxID=200917 RepID=A0A9P0KT08_ACAOB|nr:unnamed protein product [Acanthoscelides obtectus]CAK1631960.1 hypothetical protein AOBTE_LOCUS7257 [Acanthoscelides obtectus]